MDSLCSSEPLVYAQVNAASQPRRPTWLAMRTWNLALLNPFGSVTTIIKYYPTPLNDNSKVIIWIIDFQIM
jgi:hypothetical protein